MGRILTLLAIALFGGIGLLAFFRHDHKPKEPVEIVVGPANVPVIPEATPPPPSLKTLKRSPFETFCFS